MLLATELPPPPDDDDDAAACARLSRFAAVRTSSSICRDSVSCEQSANGTARDRHVGRAWRRDHVSASCVWTSALNPTQLRARLAGAKIANNINKHSFKATKVRRKCGIRAEHAMLLLLDANAQLARGDYKRSNIDVDLRFNPRA